MAQLSKKSFANKPLLPNRRVETPLPAGWSTFAKRLASVLYGLSEGQFLILSHKVTGLYIQFSLQNECELRLETISNHFRERQQKLAKAEIELLISQGWEAPTRSPKVQKKKTPNGSPNYFIDISTDCYKVADYFSTAVLVVQTLVNIIGAAKPVDLEYESFGLFGSEQKIPKLGIDQKKKRVSNLGKRKLLVPRSHADHDIKKTYFKGTTLEQWIKGVVHDDESGIESVTFVDLDQDAE